MEVISELVVLRVGPGVVPAQTVTLARVAAGGAGGRSQSRGCPGRPFCCPCAPGSAGDTAAVTAFVPKQIGGGLAEKPKDLQTSYLFN